MHFQAQLRRFNGRKCHAVPTVFLDGKIRCRAHRDPPAVLFLKQLPGLRHATLACAGIVKPINLGAGNLFWRGNQRVVIPIGGFNSTIYSGRTLLPLGKAEAALQKEHLGKQLIRSLGSSTVSKKSLLGRSKCRGIRMGRADVLQENRKAAYNADRETQYQCLPRFRHYHGP